MRLDHLLSKEDMSQTHDGSKRSEYCSILREQELQLFPKKWGFSSAGRAPALQAGGQGFDSLNLHQKEYGNRANSSAG